MYLSGSSLRKVKQRDLKIKAESIDYKSNYNDQINQTPKFENNDENLIGNER